MIADFLQAQVDAQQLTGVVSILATTNQILQMDCIGYANRELQTRINEEGLFWMASTTKIVTAVAVMMLVDEGEIDLDDPIERYIPNFFGYRVGVRQHDGTMVLRPPKSLPTVRQALAHTTGWRHKSHVMNALGMDSTTLQQHAMIMTLVPMDRDPGTKFIYSNAGIDLAGAVLERVAGMSYEDFLQKRIFTPLGMTHTSFFPSRELQKRLVTPYQWKNGKIVLDSGHYYRTLPLEDRNIRFAEAGGGIFSTPLDMLRFFQMLANNGVFEGQRFLSTEAIDEMTTNQNGGQFGYGLGTRLLENGWFGHRGSHGTNSYVQREKGWVRLYLTQMEENHPERNDIYDQWSQMADKRLEELTAQGAGN